MSENSVLYKSLPVPPKQNVMKCISVVRRPPFHVREILETIGVSQAIPWPNCWCLREVLDGTRERG